MFKKITMSHDKNPWLYFVVAFGWSWLFWILAALSGQNVMQFPVVLLFVLGGLGPPLAGILLTYRENDLQGWRDYWRRVIDFKRINPAWWAVILLFSPVRSALAIGVGLWAGEPLPSFNYWVVSAGASRLLVDLGWPGTLGTMKANLKRISGNLEAPP